MRHDASHNTHFVVWQSHVGIELIWLPLLFEYSCLLNLFCWLILDWQETTKPWGVKASLMLDRLDMTEIVATRPHHSLTFTHWNRQKFVLSQILIIVSRLYQTLLYLSMLSYTDFHFDTFRTFSLRAVRADPQNLRSKTGTRIFLPIWYPLVV